MAEFSALEFCLKLGCVLSPDSFSYRGWRAVSGGVRAWRPESESESESDAESERETPPSLLLEPRAWVSLEFVFTPPEPALLAAPLYLRYVRVRNIVYLLRVCARD